jgi:hypothetical protein
VQTPPKKEEPRLKNTPKPTVPVKYDRKDYISNKGKGKGGTGIQGGGGYYGNDNPATQYY